MMETLAENIRTAEAALARARAVTAVARRIIDAVRGERMRAMQLRAEAVRLHASARYNKPR